MTHSTPAAELDIFTEIFRDWDTALAANDTERIAHFATAEWTFVSPEGPYPGSAFLAVVSSGAVIHHTMTSKISSVRVLGDTAVVVARVVNTGTYEGQPFENDEWTSDVFVRRDGRWRCEFTHLTPARVPHFDREVRADDRPS
ncbi:nuclear transport factor 2 family protein [Nocardia carnea]|uniref:nuclear transport factor 2 family protein n=1 Tax=Nocardia carnea TaxID=37328 RepID=UPI002456D12F|nr:nuclear transport factor 2 family protein [Nocardia carnea]